MPEVLHNICNTCGQDLSNIVHGKIFAWEKLVNRTPFTNVLLNYLLLQSVVAIYITHLSIFYSPICSK